MYFDDVSRHGVVRMDWLVQAAPASGSVAWSSTRHVPQSNLEPPTPLKSLLNLPSYTDQKNEALQRMLLGYDAASASLLSAQEIAQQIGWWSKKAGVVGRSLGDELYRESMGVAVCNATSSVQAVAQFWGCVAEFLWNHADRELQAVATSSLSLEVGSTGGGREAEKVFFVVFPNCPDLYDYNRMFTLVAAMEFAKESSRYLGKRLTLGIFHPHYKHSPKLLSPERHSPFPVVALQLDPGQSPAVVPPPPKDARPKRQRGNYIVRKPRTSEDDDDEDDEEAVQRAYGRIHNLDEQRDVLEVLFNSAAVPGSDAHPVGSPHRSPDRSATGGSPVSGDVPTSTPEQVLSRSFRDEHQWRTRRLPDDAVREMCQHWMAQHRFVDARHTLPNRALRFMDTIDPARWTISSAKVGEVVYAEVWAVIHELYELGRQAEQRLASAAAVPRNGTSEDARPSVPPAAHQPFHHFVLRSLLSLPPVPSPTDKPPRRPPVVLSSMLVSTKFCAFNAPAFKRFAISINAALKRLSQGRMFLEVFHNEYVGQEGFDHSLRRSPFPMIQICYEVSKASMK